MLDYMTIAYFF